MSLTKTVQINGNEYRIQPEYDTQRKGQIVTKSEFTPQTEDTKSPSATPCSDHEDYLKDEKINRRRRGNTESQARNRQHQKIVAEKYAKNDKLIAWAKERLIGNRTNAEQILRDILTKYEQMPTKTRATRYDTRTKTGLISLVVI